MTKLRELAGSPQWANNDEAQAFLHEAESLLAGTETSAPKE